LSKVGCRQIIACCRWMQYPGRFERLIIYSN